METNKTTKTDIYKIDPRNIVVEDGFNSREDFGDIDILAKQIEENGVLNPISVVPFKDENGNEKYRLIDGERRYRAVMSLLDRGVSVDRIPALFQPKSADQKALLVQQIIRNEGKGFNEMELAIAYKKLLDEGMTKEEIAEKIAGGKHSKVNYCLGHLNRDERIQKLIADGKVSGVLVRQIYSAHGKDDKDGAVKELLELAERVEGKIETDGNSKKARATKKDLLSNDVQLRQDSTAIRKGITLLLMYNEHYNPDKFPIGSMKTLCDRLRKETIDEIIKSAVDNARDKIKSA